MIVTKSWLNEFIEISDISTEQLCKTFNAIGLEVDSITHYEIPERIVIGEVLECVPHPDATKLSVCKVDIGSSTRQIVCGAANVRAGIKVPVATIGAHMPGGLVIKPVQLRGVDSEGMICSSTEIGLPKLEEGIMILDESFGDLVLGSELREHPLFNDDRIEIELTANRGDCLSIHGIARDLSAAFNRNLREISIDTEKEGRVGIGRIAHLQQSESIEADLSFRAADISALKLPALVALRLAQIEEPYGCPLDGLIQYAIHATGVILRAYGREHFTLTDDKKIQIEVGHDANDFAIVGSKERIASTIGIYQEEDVKVCSESAEILVEASYIDPEIISRKMAQSKRKSGPLYYRTSRGSEPQLDLGLSYLFDLVHQSGEAKIYGGSIDVTQNIQPLHVTVSAESINAFIGAKIEKSTINQILKKLGFEIEKSQGEQFSVEVPRFRHDIVNRQDIVEEIVRLVGIDNIPSKPFVLKENFRFNDDYHEYQKRRTYRYKAAYAGFYESVHFVFGEKQKFEAFGFTCTADEKALLNPITATLDTLRPTLMLSLLEAASMNAKSGQRQISLFEIGSVFDPQRVESQRMAMVCSGDRERESLANAGRPKAVDFQSFARSVSTVIGDFDLKTADNILPLMHPFQSADVIQNGEVLGTLFKLHPNVQEDYDLGETFACELDFSKLSYALQTARPYSKYQASFRDLSIVVRDSVAYGTIAAAIETARSAEVIRFYPVDRYKDASLGENSSLTLRFVLQSLEKTLEEEDITSAMESILGALQTEVGAVLR